MEKTSGSSSHNDAATHSADDTMSWAASADFERPGRDFFDMDDFPPKRRQRRQRLRSLHSFNSYVARTGIVAVAASASLLTRQMESMSRVDGTSQHSYQHEDGSIGYGVSVAFSAAIANFKSGLGWAVGNVAARVGELASSLADAIGEPPQRVFAANRDEHDMPLLLFFATNLCVLCTVASVLFFIFTFCADPVGPSDSSPEPEAIEKTHLTPYNLSLPSNSTKSTTAVNEELLGIQGIFRVIVVFSISLAAGGGLGLRHPCQSAMLCGC